MMTYLTAWAVCATLASFVVLVVVVALEIRDHLTASTPTPNPTPAPRIPEQRRPTAAAIVTVTSAETFDEFLRELIMTPHVESVLS